MILFKVTAAIMIDNGKVLIAQRKPSARLALLWEFPGGKLENGETPEQCLKRELDEEFEIEVKVGAHLGTSIWAYDFGTVELMAFNTKLIGGEFRLNDHVQITWVSREEIDAFEFAPADLPFVEMIRRGEIEL
jgi:8-oxo-dGTP diphosphatase